jgi:NitT/TauT family transport system substrate-binding protein
LRVLIGTVLAHILACVTLAGGPAAAQVPVKVALDWKFEGPQAPFLVAAERGYFAAEGLDVTVEPGPARSSRSVASRRDPIRSASATSTR